MLTSVVASPAFSEENKALSEDGNVYGRVGVGFLSINDVDFSSSAAAYGVTVSANGTLKFGTGYAASGAVGFKVADNLDAEVELGYSKSSYDRITGNLNATVGATTYTVAGSANVDGSIATYSGLANLIYNFGEEGGLIPYVGGGLGLVRVVDKIDSVGTLAVNGEEKSTDLAGNLILGFDASVNEGLTAGARYKYFWANTGQSGIEDATAHGLMANIAFRF